VTWLTRRGLVAAALVGAATLWGAGWRGGALLGVFLVSGSLLTQAAAGGGGRRTARQVLANGAVAAGAALLGHWPAFGGALAAATADTWATEIGAFSRTPPRLIIGGTAVPRGTSGGITALGTAGGVLGASVMAGLAAVLQPRGVAAGPATLAGFAAVVAVAGVVGMVMDSVLGATLQARYECPACGAQREQRGAACHGPPRLMRGIRWLDNDTVNLSATIVGAGCAALGWALL
jgi:uncharacterized protein (TIGR00297 family)